MPVGEGENSGKPFEPRYVNTFYLLTWNCRHLANANKFGHIRRVNTLLGLYVPSLVTPLELLGQMP